MKPWLTIRKDGPTLYVSDHTGSAMQTSDLESSFYKFVRAVPRTAPQTDLEKMEPYEDAKLRIYLLGDVLDDDGNTRTEWMLWHNGERLRYLGCAQIPVNTPEEMRHDAERGTLAYIITNRLYPEWQPSLTLPYFPPDDDTTES